VLPGVPALNQFVVGYEATAWFGIGAPKDTPRAIVDTLNHEINAGLADPGLNMRLVDLGGEVSPSSPDDFRKFIAAETEKWAKVVRFAGIKPE
jgi:tripartite-type tricarboxylate transporter receptor subunit TctC